MRLNVYIQDLGINEEHEFSKIPQSDETWALYVKDDLRKYKVLTVSGIRDEKGVSIPRLVTVESIRE